MKRLSNLFRPIHNLSDRPFAAALAFLLTVQMITQFLGIGLTADALFELVPRWMLTALSVTYGMGGVLIFVGLMSKRGDYEAAGCILVLSGLFIRLIALFLAIGFNKETLSAAVFYSGFGWACWERFLQIVDGDRIIRIHRATKLSKPEEESK